MTRTSSKGIYAVLRGSFLTDEGALKNWRFIIFTVGLFLVMIWSAHSIDEKVTKVAVLNKKKRELRAEYIDAKTRLARMKLESAVRKRVYKKGLAPAKIPPQKIKITIDKD